MNVIFGTGGLSLRKDLWPRGPYALNSRAAGMFLTRSAIVLEKR